MADHCESCGTTEGLLLRHPNRDLHMIICTREYVQYKRTGNLAQSLLGCSIHWLIIVRRVEKEEEQCSDIPTTIFK